MNSAQTQKPKTNYKLIGGIFLLILVGIASTTVFVLFAIGGFLKSPVSNQGPTAYEIQIQTDNEKKEVPGNESDWLVYRDEDYGFEFSYPFRLIPSNSDYYDKTMFDGGSSAIHVKVLPVKLDPENIEGIYGEIGSEYLETAIIGSRTVYYFREGDAGVGGNSYRIPLDDTHSILLWFVSEGGNFFDEGAVISSFKFNETERTDVNYVE